MKYTSLEPTKREQLNKLEQIRALDNNIKIKVLITDYNSISVDIPSDLFRNQLKQSSSVSVK